MPSAKTVWGIDVGQCALKALKLQWRDGKLRALSFDVIEHAKILSQPDADEQALIRSALGKFLSRNSIKGSTLVISVPGQASFTRFIKLPPVELRKIPEIVRYEARQQIPFNLEEVVWDYQTITPPAAGPREVEVGIFAMKRDIVADYVSDFLAMKIEPDIVQMSPVALYNYLRYDKKEATGATVLIDVGAENTNLVIAEGTRVWIRNIPLGGNNFTQALCKEFKLPFAKAESLKRHAAESKHARQVFQAMRPVFGDLLTEVQRSIGYYTSLHRDSRIGRVVTLGNAFRLAGLTKFLSQNLGVEVEKVEGFAELPDAEPLSAPLFRENILSFGVCFGLAIQGLGLGVISTSLLPPEILNQKVMKRKRPFFVAAGVGVVGAVLCFASDQMRTNAELVGRPGQPTIARLKEAVDAAQAESTKQKGLFDEQKKVLLAQQEKIAEIDNLVLDPSYSYNVLRTLWNVWPYDDRAATLKAPTDAAIRAQLNAIEMLSCSMHMVTDVRDFSEIAGAGGAPAGEITVIGTEPTPPATPPADGGAAPEVARPTAADPVPGVFVRVLGITPRTGGDGQKFVQEFLIEPLKKCKRTVHLRTPQGEEILARVKLTNLFKATSEYQEYTRVRKAAAATPAPAAGMPTAKTAETPASFDKSADFWFEAHWVVELNPLREAQRREVYAELARIEDALREPLGKQVERLKLAPATDWLSKDKYEEFVTKAANAWKAEGQELQKQRDVLALAWLISADELWNIRAEGNVKTWPKTPAVTEAPK